MVRHYRLLLLFVILASLAIGLYGCGEVGPTATFTEGRGALPSESLVGGLSGQGVPSSEGVDSGTVCVEKDTDSWTWAFYDQDQPGVLNYFTVPPDAVGENTTISLKVTKSTYWDESSGQWSYWAEFDFAPDGLVFRKKAELHIDARWLDLKDGEKVVLRYYDEAENVWEEVKTKKVKKGTVEFKIEHFSRYAISR
jgi:hypothetical protein